MKKSKLFFALTMILITCILFTGCQNQNETLAKNLDNTVTNLIYSVSSLDWADSTSINQFLNNSNSNNTSQNSKVDNVSLTKTIDCENCTNCEDCTCPECENKYSKNTNIDTLIINDNSVVNKSDLETTIQNLTTSNNIQNQTSVNNSNIKNVVTFATQEITNSSDAVQNIITNLITKRAKIQLLIDQLYGGKTNLSQDDVSAINAYMNIIKENTSYLNSNKGIIANQLAQAKEIYTENAYSPLVNAYIIRTNEVIETRLSKLSSSILAIDSICEIIENSSSGSIVPQSISNVSENQTQSRLKTSELSNDNNKNETISNMNTKVKINQKPRNQYFPPVENLGEIQNLRTRNNPYSYGQNNPYLENSNLSNYNQYYPYQNNIDNHINNEIIKRENLRNISKLQNLNKNSNNTNTQTDIESSFDVTNTKNNNYSSITSNQNLEETSMEINTDATKITRKRNNELDDELLVRKQKSQEEIIKNQSNIKSRETKQELQNRDNLIKEKTSQTSTLGTDNKIDINNIENQSQNKNNENNNHQIDKEIENISISNFIEDKENSDPNLKTSTYSSGGYVMNKAERVKTMPYRNY